MKLNEKGFTVIELLIVFVFLISIPLCGLCLQYTLNTWLLFLGKAATAKLWWCCIIAAVPVVGQSALPAAAITWMLMLFL